MLLDKYRWVDLGSPQVQALIARVRAGERDARLELFDRSLWVVRKAVYRLGDAARDCGIEDAQMEGCAVLLQAIDHFAASDREPRTYGAYVYRRVLHDLSTWAARELCGGVTFGEGAVYKGAIARLAARFRAEHGRLPRPDELADSDDLPRRFCGKGKRRRLRAVAAGLAALAYTPLSLDRPNSSLARQEVEDWEYLAERFGCVWLDESALEQSDRRRGIALALGQLTAERRRVIERCLTVMARGGEVWDVALELARTEGQVSFAGYRSKIYRALHTLTKCKWLRELG